MKQKVSPQLDGFKLDLILGVLLPTRYADTLVLTKNSASVTLCSHAAGTLDQEE